MEEKNKNRFNLDPDEMAQVGLHFGHKKSRLHPKMLSYIFGVRNAIHIIDLEKTKVKFEEALRFIQGLISENKILLIVGTKVQARNLVKELATECGFPYINARWLGGTFTNFEVIKKRIEYFKELEKRKASGDLEKYTKKERMEIDKELKELELKFGGIKNLERLPDVIFVLDMEKDKLAVREALQKGIKIIAISDTNTDPTVADYPIPANNSSLSSLQYILGKIKEAILVIKKEAQTKTS